MGSTKSELARCIYQQGDQLVRLARAIHADPELAFLELNASARLVEFLCDNAFEIRTGVCDLASAFVASRGAGALHLMFWAEYNALDDGVGQGSERHLVAGAAVGAAVGLAPFVEDVGLTVSVLGTPRADLRMLRDRPADRRAHAVLMLVVTAVGATPRAAEYARIRTLHQDAPLRRAFERNAAALGLMADASTSHAALGTDLGDVAVRIPVIAPTIALRGTAEIGTRDFAALADTDHAYQGMLHAAVALAWTAYDAATERELRAHLLAARLRARR